MTARLIETLAELRLADAETVLKLAEDRSVLGADSNFAEWSHDGQDQPEGEWRTWVMMAGRGFGKTRAGAEWIARRAREDGDLRIALVAATIDEARKIMVEGASGLLAVGGQSIERWWPTRRLLRFRNGAEARLFSGHSPEMLRGPEHHIAWCDELAKWDKAKDCWDMLQFGLRLGDQPRALITTTPRPGPVLRAIMAAKATVQTGGPTRHNPHLPRIFVDAVEDLYGGTRLGRQELEGELLSDTPGALWTEDLLERCRIALADVPRFTRTVIGIDPPSGGGTCGIIACAIDAAGIAYVLADHSVTGLSPERWARAVANAAEAHAPHSVIAESNQGGAMVEAVLRGADAALRVTPVHAATSKSDRAAPIATRFESGKVKLCGHLPALEAQLCGLIAGGTYQGPGRSPDRADAMVWALTELMMGRARAEPRVRVL